MTMVYGIIIIALWLYSIVICHSFEITLEPGKVYYLERDCHQDCGRTIISSTIKQPFKINIYLSGKKKEYRSSTNVTLSDHFDWMEIETLFTDNIISIHKGIVYQTEPHSKTWYTHKETLFAILIVPRVIHMIIPERYRDRWWWCKKLKDLSIIMAIAVMYLGMEEQEFVSKIPYSLALK